ncbi:MAG: VOC family protein, partial [Rhodocyclaceae bacterium]|nr:VOC family protein [Rhodocyclaceae bacterium]
PYLFFEGCCEDALNFYVQRLGAEITALMRFADAPPGDSPGEGCGPGPTDPNKVMHANLKIGDAMIMASDGMASGETRFEGFSLSLSVPDEATARAHYAALTDGGQVLMPLGPTFFAHQFGMVADRFGVRWMIILPREL